MRKTVVIFALITLCLILPISLLHAEDTISFSYDNNLPPYCWEEEGQMRGIFIDLVTAAIEKRMGMRVIHKKYPWKRTVEMAKAGKVDGFLRPCSLQDDWAQSCPEVALLGGQRIFAYAGSPMIEKIRALKNTANFSYNADLYKWEALRPFKWVAGRGEAPFEAMSDNGFDVHFLGWDSLFKFIAEGRADAMIMARHMGLFQIKKLGLQEKIIEMPASISQSYCFFINSQSPFLRILPELGKVLREMKKEGIIEDIESKYIR